MCMHPDAQVIAQRAQEQPERQLTLLKQKEEVSYKSAVPVPLVTAIATQLAVAI